MKSQTINLKYTLNSAQTFLVVGCSDARVNLFMEEIWKDLTNYVDVYEISNFGNIRSLERVCNNRLLKAKPLKQSICSAGYKTILLSNNGIKKRYLVHRLVMSCFYGSSKLTVNHIDGNKLNNHIDNLEYLTQRENSNHYYKNKTHNIRKTSSNKYRVEIRVNGKVKSFGTHDNIKIAIKERNKQLKQI